MDSEHSTLFIMTLHGLTADRQIRKLLYILLEPRAGGVGYGDVHP